MTEPEETCDSIMRELNNVVISDTDETEEQEESFSFHEEQDLDDIPPSLLRYFETSKSRAAVCEKLILEEPADFIASHHTEDVMNLPIELDKDMMKLKEQVICDSENEENNTSSDTRLLPAPTETEALFTHNVSVCPNNNEDEAGTHEYMESEKHFAFEMRTLEMSLNEEERKKMNEYKAERQKQYCAEEEQKRQIERDFQRELKKIMEAEMLHQMELELMEKRAQEKLEQEFLLQQELISNLQRRVVEERSMREEEQKRMKEEQDKKKREDEKIKIEAERKRTEEEEKIKREAERKRMEEEEKIKIEAERKRMEEEEKIKIEAERKRMEEEEKIKIEAERKRMEEETAKKKEEERKIEEIKLKKEERKNEEEEKRRMEREEKRKREEERYQMDLEKKMLEDEMRMMDEEEERKKKEKVMRIQEEEEERKRIEEAKKMETEKGKGEERMSLKKEEEESDNRKKMAQEKMYEEVRKRDKKECGNVDEEIKLKERKKKEEKERKKMEKTPRPLKEDEERKREDERRAKEEEQKRRQKKKMRYKDEEDYRKSEEDMRLKEDKEGYKKYDVDRKMQHESKTKDKEEKQDVEKGHRKEERNHVEAEETQNKEEMVENKKEVNNKTEEEITLKKTEVRANEVQEKKLKIEHNSMIGQNEKNNMDKKERCVASQLEDGPCWASVSPAPSHSESTVCPATTEAMILQRDLDKNMRQTTIDKTVDCENQEARASIVSPSLPMCLPEHTEQKRLTWMQDCIPWSKLSLQNRRKQKGSVRSRRGAGRAAEAGSLPPLCPDTLLQATGWKSLQQVTTVTLEDLPGCNLSTLAQCTQLRSLSLRRCGLKSLEGINQLPHLCYIDVQENDISFVDCENMTSLRVLQLGHNKLTSIRGLAGAENLDVLDLSHNSITRIAGLESMRRLQRLSIDHNQLISTKGLRDVYTLLHLNCSHNHLASVEGLENSALLNTLDLRANSLTEPPSLNNQVLLRELHLDDNSISSLQGLTACWLPLMQHLSVAQNRITHLPSMLDFVSLANLDLRFNCMSELQNVCESLDGCQFLREVHLTGNPLQQESGWRSTLQKAVPGLRAIDEQETNSSLMPPAVQQVSLASGSFLTFCQAQLQQICDLQQQHSRELSNASSSLDAVQTSCRHFTEALQLAEDQRFAHEYGDTTVADQHRPAGRTTPKETLDLYDSNAEKHADRPGTESTGKVPSVILKDNIRCSSRTFDEKSPAESLHANLEVASASNHQDLDVQDTAAAVIQQLWRKYREKCGNISSPSTAEKGGGRGGDGREPESRPSYINGSVVGKDYAATVIQAFWRGFTLRRRLASALAAVTCPDTGEDDTFEEVDVDEFVFDEAALEKTWILPPSEDPPCRRYPVSEQPLSLEPPGPFPEPSQYIFPPALVQRPKQAWVAREQADSAGQRVSPVSSNRSKSPASNSEVSGLSERSEKILEEWGFTNSHTALLMLKRAQNMKSKKQQQKKQRDPSTRLALFRNCSYQLGPAEARKRQARQNRTDRKVCEAELGLQREEKTERVKQEQAQQWLHTQAAHSDRDSESMRFLPEISSDILNGGRVQLVADPGYTERLHHASGLWANSSLAAQPCKENNYPRRNSFGHAREEIPALQRVTSAPTKKERISFRDNPVQLSGGWGGGKKRGKVHK